MQELLGHTSWACATFPTQSQASLVALKAQHGSANQCLSHPTSGGPLCPATVPPPRSRGAYPVWLNPVSHISSVPHDAWSDVPSPILRDHKVTLSPAPGTNVSAQARGCTTETLVRPAALGQKEGQKNGLLEPFASALPQAAWFQVLQSLWIMCEEQHQVRAALGKRPLPSSDHIPHLAQPRLLAASEGQPCLLHRVMPGSGRA